MRILCLLSCYGSKTWNIRLHINSSFPFRYKCLLPRYLNIFRLLFIFPFYHAFCYIPDKAFLFVLCPNQLPSFSLIPVVIFFSNLFLLLLFYFTFSYIYSCYSYQPISISHFICSSYILYSPPAPHPEVLR